MNYEETKEKLNSFQKKCEIKSSTTIIANIDK